MTRLAALPESERPRERLLSHGVEALSLVELIALCLGSGTKGKSVLTLSHELLAHFGSINALLEASIPQLQEIKGVGQAKAIQLKAIFGIVKQYTKPVGVAKFAVKSPQDVVDFLKYRLVRQKNEEVVILLRDVKGFIFHDQVIARGTLSDVLIHPREVFYPAIEHRAYSLIIAHNHPSGDPKPSKKDIQVTRLLKQTGQIMGIRLDDHIVVGRVSTFSFYEQGYFTHNRY